MLLSAHSVMTLCSCRNIRLAILQKCGHVSGFKKNVKKSVRAADEESGVQSSTERYSDDHPHLYHPLFRSLYLDNHGSAERTCVGIREHTNASSTGVPSTRWRSREVDFHSGGERR